MFEDPTSSCLRSLGLALGLLSLSACNQASPDAPLGDGRLPNGKTPEQVTPGTCTEGSILPGPSPLRRLTRFEYNNTLRDLLGDTTAPGNRLPLEEQSLGFDNDANVLKVSRLLAEAYVGATQLLADAAVPELGTWVSCAAQAQAPGSDPVQAEQCASQFIDAFGPRAYRRALAPEERARMLALYTSARQSFDFNGAVGAVIEAMLLSPQFLYRLESTLPVAGNPNVLAVDSWGLASRLSYFLWGSMPDPALFDVVRAGQLVTAADVRAQAERMFDDPRTRSVVRHFNRYWLDIGGVDGQTKDAALFPDYTSAIGPLLRQQTENFVEHVYFGGAGTLNDLLTAPYTFMNGPLATFHGLSNGPTGEAFVKVDLDPTRHSGVLTEPSILSWNATADRTHPILRGVFIRRKFLCQEPPPPPPGVVDSRGTIADPNATERERLAIHSQDPICAACHASIEPIGLAFENFDATGRWRDLEGGRPVDATGHILGTDVEGDVNGAIELTQKLAQSEQVRQCVALNWFRFANGRGETEQDVCSTQRVNQRFADSGGNLRELVLTMTQTDAFLYRMAPSSEAMP